MMWLRVGEHVAVRGLTKRPELNGKHGEVAALMCGAKGDRVKIVIDELNVNVLVLPTNLVPVPHAGPGLVGLGIRSGNGIATFTLKDCASVTHMRDLLVLHADSQECPDAEHGELFSNLAKKLRTHVRECDEAIRIDIIGLLCTRFLGAEAATRTYPGGERQLIFHFLEATEGSLSIFFEMCRYRQGCVAFARALVNVHVCDDTWAPETEPKVPSDALLWTLVRLARGLATGFPRPPPLKEDEYAEMPGFFAKSRNQIEQALVDTLGRALAGLNREADAQLRKRFAETILESELGRGKLPQKWAAPEWDETGELAGELTGAEGYKLLTRLKRVPPTKWTDLAESAYRLTSRLRDAVKGEFLADDPWLPRYVMERDIEQKESDQMEKLANALNSGMMNLSPSKLAEVAEKCEPVPGRARFKPSDWAQLQETARENHRRYSSVQNQGPVEICYFCGKMSGGGCAHDGPMQRCGQCRTAVYCSVACQKRDWKKHKESCIPVRPPEGYAGRSGAKIRAASSETI